MTQKPYNMKRERSKNMIINELKNGPKRFTDLQNETGLSAVGLNDTLKMMKNENIVESVLIDDKQKYRLTKKGENIIEKYSYLSNDINAIRFRYGTHIRDYSRLWGSILSSELNWGIESDLTLDNDIKDLNLLEPNDVAEIEKFVYEKLAKNINKDKVKKVENGKMILGFSIDYNELVKSIKEKALAYYNHISEEEWKLLEKIDGSPDCLTEKEGKRLVILRKKTYEKIKKLDY